MASTAGALHLADSSKWLAAERQARAEEFVRRSATTAHSHCTLAEAAAAHAGREPVKWLLEFWESLAGETGTVRCC